MTTDETLIDYLKTSLDVAARQRDEACAITQDLRKRLDLAERRLKWIAHLTTAPHTQGVWGTVPRAAVTNALGLTEDIRYPAIKEQR